MANDNAPVPPSDRARAYRLRRRAPDAITDEDRTWLAGYDARLQNTRAVEVIEHREERSIATGDAALPDASAELARAEGMRVDTLLQIATNGLERALSAHERMTAMMLGKVEALMTAQVSLVNAVREQVLARTAAEVELAHATSEPGDETTEVIGLVRDMIEAGRKSAASKSAK
jgi:hypothetical protein